jgi:hypothetical protein
LVGVNDHAIVCVHDQVGKFIVARQLGRRETVRHQHHIRRNIEL